MALPGNVILETAIPAQFKDPINHRFFPLVDYEIGGTNLNQPGEGHRVKLWTLRYETPNMILSAPGVPDAIQFSRTGITEVGLAFDQNMRPFVAFVENGVAKYWWYDTVAAAQVFTDLPATSANPRCCMDDSRPLQFAINDIILAYTKGGDLYYRQQRDRFATERLLKTAIGGNLEAIGMSEGFRLQFLVRLP